MKIGIEITPALAGGGYRRYAEDLLAALVRRHPQHAYFLFAAFWTGFPERFERLKLPKGANIHPVLKRWPQKLVLPAEEYLGLRFVERALEPFRLDVLHGLGSILPKMKHVPTVVTVHYPGPQPFDRAWERFYFDRLTESAVKQATRVIAISEFTKTEALKAWKLPLEKVKVVPHGGPDARFRPRDGDELPPWLKPPYFLFVGTLFPQKNPVLLTEAFVRAAKELKDHSLVFAGAQGEETPKVKALLERHGLADRAYFPGPVAHDNMPALYRRAEALVCASPLEGFAFPAVEAMACATPVIGVDAGALPETIRDAGLIVPPESEALAGAMTRVATDRALRDRLVRSGPARARAFDWDKTADATMAVYKEAAGT